MANLSITTAWNEASTFVSREARLLFPLAFMLVALPMAVVGALAPQPQTPQEVSQPGLWFGLFLAAALMGVVGNLAISTLALRPGQSVGEAIGRGFRRFPSLLGAILLLMLAGMALFFIAAIIMVMLVPGAASSASAGVANPALAAATGLVILLLLPVLLYFGARLAPMTPLAAAEDTGPIGVLSRSWTLTRGHALKLVAFLIVIGLTAGVISFAVQAIAGLAAMAATGSIQPGTTGAFVVQLVLAAVNTVVATYITCTIAFIYAQLSGTRGAEVFS